MDDYSGWKFNEEERGFETAIVQEWSNACKKLQPEYQ